MNTPFVAPSEEPDYRWRLHLTGDRRIYIAGDKVDIPGDRNLHFILDEDGSTVTYKTGQWTSLFGIPSRSKTDIPNRALRAWMLGKANLEDVRMPWTWWMTQPEFLAEEEAYREGAIDA
jgi:hypothetical protein